MPALSGTAHLRPVRLGFVAENPSREMVRDAARQASGVWGGMYFPIFDSCDPNLPSLVEALAVDALHALDDAESTKSICDQPGYRWRGGAEWGPFGRSSDPTFTEGLLPIDRLIGTADAGPLGCGGDDNRGALYDAWLGCDARSADARPPALNDVLGGEGLAASAIARTAAHIEYLGTEPGLVVVLVGDEPEDLVRLWNHRAAGGLVQPWILDEPEASTEALLAWLRTDDVIGNSLRARRGDGTDLGPLINLSAGPHATEGSELRGAIEKLGFPVADYGAFWGGWRGHHPLATAFERSFEVDVARDAWYVDIPLPALPLDGPPSHWPGMVCADIVVHREGESDSGRTFSLPAIRALGAPIDRLTRDVERFHRATGEGRAMSVQAAASVVTVALVPTVQVFDVLLPDGATLGQSDDGRFATQFVDRLGGPNSVAASQPAVRQVLYDLSNADRSAPVPKLIEAALNARGSWPDLMSRQEPRDYAKSVVYGLVNTGLVVPTNVVRCPRCATETDVRPEDLAAEMRCIVCRSDLNLGLALALQGLKNPWRYRLAAHLPTQRIRSGLAVMAVSSVIRSAHRAGSAPAVPHIFGLTVALDGWSCEIDLATLIMDGPLTIAVVGEVKGGRDQVNATDVSNLARVQQLLRAAGVETFVLCGTTRACFEPEEVDLLRGACEAAPERLMRGHAGLALPIALCAADVSVPWFDEGHPWRWGTPGDAPLDSLARVSCHRNLGLAEGAPSWDHTTGGWAVRWDSKP